jgi:hypothetical protein
MIRARQIFLLDAYDRRHKLGGIVGSRGLAAVGLPMSGRNV